MPEPSEPHVEVAATQVPFADLHVGSLLAGSLNAITDVRGVMVGHVTLYHPEAGICTGVTAIRPHPGNPFREKVAAGVHVINGFGKAMGLAQITELGTLETPIVLTNTLSVGTAAEGLVRWMLALDPGIGGRAGTVNPVVLECNDGYLNDIRALAVRPEHVMQALAGAAAGPVSEGAVGAGTGMICYGYKGGIGTASRVVVSAAGTFTLGGLVLANFGRRQDLRILGKPVESPPQGVSPPDAGGGSGGSVIVVLATDAPLTSRQLGRLARRAVVGLVRTGSHIAHGSGDFVVAFSTAARFSHDAPDQVAWLGYLPDRGETFAQLIVATADVTEECVYHALFRARPIRGHRGRVVPVLRTQES